MHRMPKVAYKTQRCPSTTLAKAHHVVVPACLVCNKCSDTCAGHRLQEVRTPKHSTYRHAIASLFACKLPGVQGAKRDIFPAV